MAKRRMISQELIYDEHFNLLSLEAQNIFIRLLAVSDDYGFVPANEYTLRVLINPPLRLSKKLQDILNEITENGLGVTFFYNDKAWFMFKPSSFENINSYVLNKRRRSEYLKLSEKEILSENFQEILRSSVSIGSEHIESRKNKVLRRKKKEENYSNEFLRFWESYPRKEGKGKAYESFIKSGINNGKLSEVLSTIERYKKTNQWQIENGKFIPHPSTWLNQRRWEDQPEDRRSISKGLTYDEAIIQNGGRFSGWNKKEDGLWYKN